MDNEHMSDERIQEILDARALSQAVFLPWHLKTCRRCQERYRHFQRLYENLAVDPGFTLPPGFADSVLERIPAHRPALFQNRLVPVALACGAGALMVAGLALFVDLKPLASGSLRIADSLLSAFRPLARPFREFFSWLSGSAKLFVYAGLGLLAASLVDQFLRRQLQHHPH
jgi:hypothetical protein